MFVRIETLRALEGRAESQSKAGIEDAAHLAEFIQEIQNPEDARAPNWLTRFSEASEVIEKVLVSLNLGRNIWESSVRHMLVSEVSANLALLVHRLKTTAIPGHRNMASVREKYANLGADDLWGPITITEDDRVRLALALVPSVPVKKLKADVIKQVLSGGVFLSFDAASGTLMETPMHRAISQALADIEAVQALESSHGDELTKLVATLIPPTAAGLGYCVVRKLDLIWAMRYHDMMNDLFSGHVAICDALIKGNPDPVAYQRSPITPIGEAESNRIRAEQVSPVEVQHLIINQIFPFGDRVMPDSWGSTEDERVALIAAATKASIEALGVQAELPPELIEKIARDWLHTQAPPSDEGLEDLRRGC